MARWVLPRYLVAGAANTLLTYLLYLGLLPLAGYRVAYVLAFLAGVLLSFVMLRYAVFKTPGKRYSWFYVSVSHVAQLGLGLAVVEAWVAWIRAPAFLAPLAAVAVCVPLMYLAHRWIFHPGTRTPTGVGG